MGLNVIFFRLNISKKYRYFHTACVLGLKRSNIYLHFGTLAKLALR